MVYERPLRPDELMHFGVLGMKWGVRRYQNPDGSLTAAGRKHYDVEEKRKDSAGKRAKQFAAGVGAGLAVGAAATAYSRGKNSDALGKAFEQNIKQGKGKEDISPAEKISKETTKSIGQTSRALRNAAQISRKAQKMKSDPELEKKIKSMSDDELRRTINRINMERQYRELSSSDTQTGMEKAADILDVVGGITGTAASIAVIAATVKKMRG